MHMKRITIIYRASAMLAAFMFLFLLSCVDDGKDDLSGKGINRFRVPNEDNYAMLAFDSEPQTKTAFTIYRDAVSAAELNTTASMAFVISDTLLESYNEANETSLVLLDPSSYTVVGASEDGTISFAAGEFAKEIQLSLDPSVLDLSLQYAVPFVFSSNGDYTLGASSNYMIVQVGVKNEWDGNYTVTGTMVDYANSALTGPYPWNVSMVTTGSKQVAVLDLDYTGDYFHKILNAGAASYYGSFGMYFNLDDENNVVSVVNIYGQPASNTRYAELDPSGENTWDPDAKVLKVKYWMYQPSVVANGPRVSFDEVYTYTGPR